MELKKNNEANIDKKRLTLLVVGLCLSLAIVAGAFEYYAFDSGPVSLKGKQADALEEEEIEQLVLNTPPPPPPPPPPPASIEEVVIEEDDAEIEDIDIDLDAESDNSEEIIEEDEGPVVEEIFEFVGQDSEYPGGIGELYKWLGKELVYPPIAKDNNISGKVYVKFVVKKDGTIGEAFVLNKGRTHKSLEKEAIRVVKKMKKWKPAMNNGKVVPHWQKLPINFTIK